MSAPRVPEDSDATAIRDDEEVVLTEVILIEKLQDDSEPDSSDDSKPPPPPLPLSLLRPLSTLSPPPAAGLSGSTRSLCGPGPGPSKMVHEFSRGPEPAVLRARCHRHIDTVFVVIVLIAMLILVIAECVSMKRFS